MFVFFFCLCSFGETVRLLHPFHEPFTDQSGAKILQQFTFDQKKTKIAQVSNFSDCFRFLLLPYGTGRRISAIVKFSLKITMALFHCLAPRYLYQSYGFGTFTVTSVPPDEKRHLPAFAYCVRWKRYISGGDGG